MIQFTVYGRPQPKQRPRVRKDGRTYTPPKTVLYEELVIQEARRSGTLPNKPYETPVKMILWCFFDIPKSWPKKKQAQAKSKLIYPITRNCGDVDNLAKIVMDGLNGIAFKDDGQVIELVIHKQYSEEPRVEVVIDEV